MTKPRILIGGIDPFPEPVPGRNDEVLTSVEDPDDSAEAETLTSGESGSDDYVVAENGTTRKVFRPEIVPNNAKDPSATVKGKLIHQRRGKKSADGGQSWEDAEPFLLSSMKAGEEVRLELSCGETKRLFQALARLYQRHGGYQLEDFLGERIAEDNGDVLMVPGRVRAYVKKLLEEDGEAVFDHIEALRPDLLEVIAIKQQHEARRKALDQFKLEMARPDWSEHEWGGFFHRNRWIFGYGLNYQFLNLVQEQPHYGGKNLAGRHGQRGDALMATEALARFTVLLEIKRPETRLLGPRTHREGVWLLSAGLIGGVAQVQANCLTWSTDGSQNRQDAIDLDKQRISTYQPKGILVIGQTSELGDADKRSTFELFRRNLQNPEVLTYDELLARARYIVALDPTQEAAEQ